MTFPVQGPGAARAAAGLPGIDLRVPASPLRQAQLHLAALLGRGPLLELRIKTPNGWRQHFYRDSHTAARHALNEAPRSDVYVGVVPRTREAGGKDALAPARWLWVECDTQASVERMLMFEPGPRLVVRSSPGKAHAYWPLLDDLSPEWVRDANRRLCWHLGADPASTDAARILRVAGTFSHKYDEPLPVEMVRALPGRGYSAAELVGELEDPRPARVSFSHASDKRVAHSLALDADKRALLDVPARTYITTLTGRDVMHNMVQCPFHNGGQERTPSLHVGGPEDTLWHCFGCDEGGDIFNFAAKLAGLDVRNDFAEVKNRLLAVRL